MSTARPRIVFVLGTARSGSTLVGDLLSSLPGVHHLGELYRSVTDWQPVDLRRVTCGCGERLCDCPWWGDAGVLELVEAGGDEAYRRIVVRAATALDADTIVDSSKWLRRLERVRRAVGVDLVVVMRRPLVDYVRSRHRHARRKHRDPRSRPRLWLAAVADSGRWVGMELVGRVLSIRGEAAGAPVVAYDLADLWARPAAVRAELATALSKPLDQQSDERTFTTGPTHTIWGSRSRVRPDGLLNVERDRTPGWSSSRRGGGGGPRPGR